MSRASLKVSVPCYRMRGDMWHEMRVLDEWWIAFALMPISDSRRVQEPRGTIEALDRYKQTVADLLSSGI